MFNIFIAETILKQVIETEGKKPEASRSYLYKIMRMKLVKKVYVAAETPDAAWAKPQEPLGDGWGTVLKSLKGIPSNALLLTDRYLFSGYYPKFGNGIDNVQSILDTLLPKTFLGEYHVTVVFDNDNKNEEYSFNDIASQLYHVKQSLHRTYPINMEVLGITEYNEVYDKRHNRRIISNYYTITRWQLSTRTLPPASRPSPHRYSSLSTASTRTPPRPSRPSTMSSPPSANSL